MAVERMAMLVAGNSKLHDQNTELMAGVDEARAEVERLSKLTDQAGAELADRYDAKAEVERLRAELRKADADGAIAALALMRVNFWLDEFAAPQGASPEAIAQASRTQGDVLRARLSEARAEVERLKAELEAVHAEADREALHARTEVERLKSAAGRCDFCEAHGRSGHATRLLESLRERCAAAVEFSLAGFSCVCSFRAAEAVRAVPLEEP